MSRSVLIIGAGSMGSALAKGLTKKETDINVAIHDLHAHRLEVLNAFPRVQQLPEIHAENFLADAVILCIKPQDLDGFADKHRAHLHSDIVVVSVLAGTEIADIATSLNFSGSIVRSMPNIPATFGEAATAMCANSQCNDAQRQLVAMVFDAVGAAWWTKESLLDAVTGLSGSGPAYIYMIIEALSDGGVKQGLPRKLATDLAIQTVLGSAVHVKETGMHPAVLKEKVTTPGGTTINAIHELEKHGLRSMLISAVATATEQSSKLRKAPPV